MTGYGRDTHIHVKCPDRDILPRSPPLLSDPLEGFFLTSPGYERVTRFCPSVDGRRVSMLVAPGEMGKDERRSERDLVYEIGNEEDRLVPSQRGREYGPRMRERERRDNEEGARAQRKRERNERAYKCVDARVVCVCVCGWVGGWVWVCVPDRKKERERGREIEPLLYSLRPSPSPLPLPLPSPLCHPSFPSLPSHRQKVINTLEGAWAKRTPVGRGIVQVSYKFYGKLPPLLAGGETPTPATISTDRAQAAS